MSELKVYVEKVNARIAFVFEEVLGRRLGLDFSFDTNQESFEANSGPRLNYSRVHMNDVPRIFPAEILFEKRIKDQDFSVSKENGLWLFSIDSKSDLPFDPLAACFFLLSRYEEYLPHRTDEHGRMLGSEFLVVKEECHQIPLVELYCSVLGEFLKKAYPSLKIHEFEAKHIVSVDVDQVFAVKSKGLLRSVLLGIRDLFRGSLSRRISIARGKSNDPNDLYDDILRLINSKDLDLMYFIQVGERSRFDINNPPHLSDVKQKINELALQAEIGLHPSYYSVDDEGVLQREVDRLKNIVPSPVTSVRQHFLRQQLPNTYRNFEQKGLVHDYSIGFHDLNGFRASTCKPFRFYDLNKEELTSLTCFPMATMDMVSARNHYSAESAVTEMKSIWKEVRKYGGLMISTWHPESLRGAGVAFATIDLLEAFIEDHEG